MPDWDDPVTWGVFFYLPALIASPIVLACLVWAAVLWRRERKRKR